MPKISVCEGIGRSLEPDYDGMHLGQRPDQGMVNIEVHHHGSDGKRERDVDAMGPGNENPC